MAQVPASASLAMVSASIFPAGGTQMITHFTPGEDGSFYLKAGNAITVDFSKASGADLVVIKLGISARRDSKKVKKCPTPVLNSG